MEISGVGVAQVNQWESNVKHILLGFHKILDTGICSILLSVVNMFKLPSVVGGKIAPIRYLNGDNYK